jgi:surface antigen
MSVAALLILCSATASVAQMSNPLGKRGTDALTADDLASLRPALGSLLETGADHATADWTSRKTGNSGTMQVLRSFERNDLKCREVAHVISLKRDADKRKISQSYCRTSDGAWKILE